MSKITAKNLIELGFKKEHEIDTEAKEGENKYHYYIYEINDKCMLISNTNDEKIKGGYEIEFYEISDIKFRNLNKLKKLIKLLEFGSR